MTATSLTSAPADWPAIDAGLAELECLAANEISPAKFYATVCDCLIKWQLPASSLWGVETQGPPRLLGSTTGNAIVSPEQVAGWLAGRDLPAVNGWFVPWKLDGVVAGGVFAGAEKSTAKSENVAQLLSAVTELCALFHSHAARREWQQRFEQQERWQKTLRQLNASLDLNETAFFVANEGRTLIGCDRVSVAVRHGNSYRLLAVSGAEHVHRRAETVRSLEQLAGTVGSFGQSVWHTGSQDDSPPQVQAAVAVYLEESPATGMGLLPLATAAERPLAVLVVEQFTGTFTAEHRAAAQWLGINAIPALRRNWQLQGVPFLKFWLAWQQAASRNQWLSRGSLAAILIAVIFAALFVIPAEIEVRATGELQPTQRYEVFAPRDGVVTEVLVDHGSRVEKDEKLLELRSPEFDLEVQRVVGELETTRQQLAAVMAERLQLRSGDAEARLKQRRLTADEEQFQEQIRGLESRRELLRLQQTELTVKSPAAGDVVTWNVKQRLSQRPLRRGDALVTIANLQGGWQLELRMPTRRAGRLLSTMSANDHNQPVVFTLNSRPGVIFHGRITEVSRRVELTETGESYVLLKGTVAEKELPELTPGTAVSARIACGRGSLGVAWFHELIDAGRWWLTW